LLGEEGRRSVQDLVPDSRDIEILTDIENLGARLQERLESFQRMSVHVRRRDGGSVVDVLRRIFVSVPRVKAEVSTRINDSSRRAKVSSLPVAKRAQVDESSLTGLPLQTPR